MKKRRIDGFVGRIDLLFARTLMGGSDAHEAWAAVGKLNAFGNRFVFERAALWCASPDSFKRERGVQIVCQLRKKSRERLVLSKSRHRFKSEPVYVEESFRLIADVISSAPDKDVLLACLYGFMHLDVASALPLVLPYALHDDASVRYAVTHALGAFHMHNEPDAIAALRRLVEDEDREVRDWAIFGLGVQGDADSEEIRLQFLRHLDDSFLDARIEAAAALGKRRDARLAGPLIRMLRRHGALNGFVEAARGLLEMSKDPKEWCAGEYIAAIEKKFPDAR